MSNEQSSGVATDEDTRWFVSMDEREFRPGDDRLPAVRASAMVEACRIGELLRRASRVLPDGSVVISAWSQRRVAMRIAEIAEKGLDSEDGFAAHEAGTYPDRAGRN